MRALAHNSSNISISNVQSALRIELFTLASTWRALWRVLCDKSSIERTYTSNHTVRTIQMITRPYDEGSWAERQEIPDVSSLLRLNKNRDKSAVARQMILTHHFRLDSTNIQVFVGMFPSVLPCAIEWICRDRIGLSLMYRVVRRIPSLERKGSETHHAARDKK